MYYKLNRLGMLTLVLVLSAGAGAQTSVPANASAQDNASLQNIPFAPRDASPQTNARPTAAQLDQPGAVITPPPILRNSGKTVVQSEQPLIGHLNLRGQRPQGVPAQRAAARLDPVHHLPRDGGEDQLAGRHRA